MLESDLSCPVTVLLRQGYRATAAQIQGRDNGPAWLQKRASHVAAWLCNHTCHTHERVQWLAPHVNKGICPGLYLVEVIDTHC
jgi:hypothetical protein